MKLKEERNKSIGGQVSVLYDDLKKMEAQVDQQAKYCHSQCSSFYGIKEEKGGDTEIFIINTVKE